MASFINYVIVMVGVGEAEVDPAVKFWAATMTLNVVGLSIKGMEGKVQKNGKEREVGGNIA